MAARKYENGLNESSGKYMGKSKLHVFGKLVIAVAALALFFACSKYDESDDYGILTDYGIAHRYGGNGVADYFIERDDGALLFIKSINWDYDGPRDGQRVKLYYQMIGASNETGESRAAADYTVSRDINLYGLIEVPVRKPVMLSSITNETGNDPLEKITRLFFSGGYLNVEYRIKTGEEEGRHLMNLVVDDTEESAGELTLYIRYTADASGSQTISSDQDDQESEVSFDIATLIPEEPVKMKINFIWRETGKGTLTRTIENFTLDPRSYKQIVGSAKGDYSSAMPAVR